MIAERRESRFALLVAVGFGVLTLPRLLTHEIWRDEAWLWLVCRESSSLAELHEALSRSGQGYLFPWLVAVAARFTASPLALQLVNLAAASGGAWVFARWAPFSRSVRVLFLLGYFPFYEYAVLSRHYALGAALVWVACAAGQRRRGTVACALALALLCQTTVYGVILAFAIAAATLARRMDSGPGIERARTEVVAALIFVLGLVAGLLQLHPRPGTNFAAQWQFGWQAETLWRAVAIPWRASVPVPRPGLHFWNTNVLDGWPAMLAGAGCALAILAFWLVGRRRAARVALVVGGCGLLVFAYVKYVGVARHHGHWWLLLWVALWFAAAEVESDAHATRPSLAPSRLRSVVLIVLLLVHAGVGLGASWMDLRHPFSNAPLAARHLVERGLGELALFGYREPPAASVALALGRPLYAPSRGVFTTHPDWGPEQRDLPLEVVRCSARALAIDTGHDVALVFSLPMPPWPEVEPVIATSGALMAAEDYWVARLVAGRIDATRSAANCSAEGSVALP